MSGFSDEVLQAAASEREVEIETYGRTTGQPRRTVIWIWGEGERLFIRSGRGLGRDWPQNLLAQGRAVIHLGDLEVPVVPRHVPPAEARTLTPLVQRKYGTPGTGDTPATDAAPTPGEQATFELFPAPPA